ncbi:MAG: DUF1579 family protein [Planctomycetota bacterium]|nr:DUF1579 family protein [Planctomycetota bacterium]
MNATRSCWPLAVALLCLSFAGRQDPKPAVRRPDANALRRARELARVAPEHEVFRRLAGSWSVSVRTTSPDGTVHEDAGEVVGRSMLGGRYLALEFSLELQGSSVEALQILGFDTLKGLYTASWRDTGSTWAVDCQGQPTDDVGKLVLFGSMVDAYTPDGRPFRLELDARDRRAVVLRISEGSVGEEVLLQEQRWTR